MTALVREVRRGCECGCGSAVAANNQVSDRPTLKWRFFLIPSDQIKKSFNMVATLRAASEQIELHLRPQTPTNDDRCPSQLFFQRAVGKRGLHTFAYIARSAWRLTFRL